VELRLPSSDAAFATDAPDIIRADSMGKGSSSAMVLKLFFFRKSRILVELRLPSSDAAFAAHAPDSIRANSMGKGSTSAIFCNYSFSERVVYS
jgi:hypothetical protein